MSVKEIVGEIPASFRADLETELTATSERVMRNIIEKIKQSPDAMIDADATHAIQVVAEKTGRALLEDWQRYLVDWQYNLGRPSHMHPEEWRHHLDRLRDLSPDERERYARHHGLPPLLGRCRLALLRRSAEAVRLVAGGHRAPDGDLVHVGRRGLPDPWWTTTERCRG